jgi:hypothetical protein
MAHFTNQPIAWNHVIRGETEFWTHKQVSVVKSRAGTYDVMVDGSVLKDGFPTSGDALHYAHAYIEDPVGFNR